MKKIAIIKLGAKGDVVRTLSILPAIKSKFPSSEITWITKENISDLLDQNPHINHILTLSSKIPACFDILYNFDIEKEASDLALKIKAEKKYGFYLDSDYPAAFNLGAEYYLNTMFDDDLKKKNKKTYQEMIFDAAELSYKKELGLIYLTAQEIKFGQEFLANNKLTNSKIIGIHMGAGPRWPSKTWSQEKIKEFIKLANKNGYKIILFGGPEEIVKLQTLIKELHTFGIQVANNSPTASNRQFASLVNLCDYVVCSDSFALHVALALKKHVIGLFFCTSPNEVEDYGLLKKIVSPKLYDFFPEKQNEFNQELINSISALEVLEMIQ